jgi:predicted DNA-binding transcriptional regulator YafY
MEFVKIYNYVELLDFYIRHECTGTAFEFAKKIGVSERTIQSHIKQLREIGINVVFDYNKRTYKYAAKGHLTFCFIEDGQLVIN